MDPRRRGIRRFPVEPWSITESDFDPEENLFRETIFTLSNGFIGVRGALEEGVARVESNPGTHLAGVYFRRPDTAVFAKGKRAFPEEWHGMATFAEVFRIRPRIGGEKLDMRSSRIRDHRRVLNLREGDLLREFTWTPRAGGEVRVRIRRFVPMKWPDLCLLRYEITAVEKAEIDLEIGFEKTDGTDERGADAWVPGGAGHPSPEELLLRMDLPASGFSVVGAARCIVRETGDSGVRLEHASSRVTDRSALLTRVVRMRPGDSWGFDLFVALRSHRNLQDPAAAEADILDRVRDAERIGFDRLHEEQRSWWNAFWARNDVVVEGDDEIRQGIRFCLFQIAQSRRPGDPSVSIGTNGLTGAMHGGLYFWDTEAYVLPPILQMNPDVARELLLYRHITLPLARENAADQGYRGAAFPWFTMNGRPNPGFYECTIGEQHINAAIPWAVERYADETGDDDFLFGPGLELLVEQARFWASRFTWSRRKNGFVLNQVTGPDEYTAFNNNNTYTNVMARWTLRFAADTWDRAAEERPERAATLREELSLDPGEPKRWREIAEAVHVPFDPDLGIHPQDDAFLDLDPVDLPSIPLEDVPLENHWPWERVLRSRLLKQADVLLLEHMRWQEFSREQKALDYAFYEPITTHDSSLSASIHALIAAEIRRLDDCRYYLYRSSRLDLDNINFNTGAGIHLANCGGTWMAIVHGIAGLRCNGGQVRFDPTLPPEWRRLAFRFSYRGRTLHVDIRPGKARLELVEGDPLPVRLGEETTTLTPERPLETPPAPPADPAVVKE